MTKINELSKDKLRNYIAASRKDAVKTITSPVNLSDRSKNNPGNWRRIEKRTAGSELAKKKLGESEVSGKGPWLLQHYVDRLGWIDHSLHPTRIKAHAARKNLGTDWSATKGSRVVKAKGRQQVTTQDVDRQSYLLAKAHDPGRVGKYGRTWKFGPKYESAELAQLGMAAIGVAGAHAVMHHAAGDVWHHIKKQAGNAINKIRGKTAKVAGTTATKTSSVDKPAANDNTPKALPKVKTTITHSEETLSEWGTRGEFVTQRNPKEAAKDVWKAAKAKKDQMAKERAADRDAKKTQQKEETVPSFNELMLARSRRLGIANQISYYENAVKNEHRYTEWEQRKLDQDSGKDLDRQARKLAAEKRKAKEQESKK